MAGLQRRFCANHPDRPGHAVCMKCGKVVCQECATTYDGINYCVACLSRQRKGEKRPTSAAAGVVGLLALSAGLFYVASRLMVWTLVLFTGWGP